MAIDFYLETEHRHPYWVDLLIDVTKYAPPEVCDAITKLIYEQGFIEFRLKMGKDNYSRWQKAYVRDYAELKQNADSEAECVKTCGDRSVVGANGKPFICRLPIGHGGVHQWSEG